MPDVPINDAMRRTVLRQALDAVVAIDANGCVREWNLQAEKVLGWSEGEAVGRDMSEMIIPDKLRHAHQQGMKHFLQTEEGPILNQRIEIMARHRTGREFPVELTIIPVVYADSYLFYSFIRDISDRKRSEENLRASAQELRASRDQLQIIFENVADGILVQDRHFKCLYANETGARMCGFPSAEAFMKSDISQTLGKFELRNEKGELFPVEKLPARLALNGDRNPPETVMRVVELESRQERWSIVTARPIFDEENNPTMAVSIFRDITLQRKAQEAASFLAEAGAVLASSLDHTKTLKAIAQLAVPKLADWCAIDLVQENGPPRSVAAAHPDPEKLKWALLMPQKYPTDWESSTGAPHVIRTGKSELYPSITPELLQRRARDAEHLQMMTELGMRSAMIVPLVASGKTLGAITFISAESGRRYTEADLSLAEDLGRRAGLAVQNALLYAKSESQSAQLREAVAVRDEFLSIASHELKTPITALKLQSDLNLKRLHQSSDSVLEFNTLLKLFATTGRQVDRLAGLVEHMLDISRIAHGKLSLRLESVDLGLLVREVLDTFDEQLKAVSCTCILSAQSNVIGQWDRYRLEQVVTNLITNGIKYGEGRPIELSVSLDAGDAGRAVLKVTDHGSGIAAENLERIFDRFERAVPSSNISGLGLGLYITRQIVETHQGVVRVVSTVGHGSTFIVELPLHAV